MPQLTIQYFSDVHLELFRIVPEIPVVAEYLAITGDLGSPFQPRYKEFLQEVSVKYKTVFLLAGNHEFYGSTFAETNAEIEKVCADLQNVFYLNNRTILIEDLTICGTTLWSDVTDDAFSKLNDSRKIFTDVEHRKRITAAEIRAVHKENVEFVKSVLADSEKVLLLTHHSPSHTMNGKYFGNDVMSGFSTDLEYLFAEPLVAWIIGHLHQNEKISINDIYCVENALGYVSERGNFDGTAVLTLEW